MKMNSETTHYITKIKQISLGIKKKHKPKSVLSNLTMIIYCSFSSIRFVIKNPTINATPLIRNIEAAMAGSSCIPVRV